MGKKFKKGGWMIMAAIAAIVVIVAGVIAYVVSTATPPKEDPADAQQSKNLAAVASGMTNAEAAASGASVSIFKRIFAKGHAYDGLSLW